MRTGVVKTAKSKGGEKVCTHRSVRYVLKKMLRKGSLETMTSLNVLRHAMSYLPCVRMKWSALVCALDVSLGDGLGYWVHEMGYGNGYCYGKRKKNAVKNVVVKFCERL